MAHALRTLAERSLHRLDAHRGAVGWAVVALAVAAVAPAVLPATTPTTVFAGAAGTALFVSWSTAFVVADAFVLRALLDDPPSLRSRLPVLLRWGVGGGLLVFACVAGARALLSLDSVRALAPTTLLGSIAVFVFVVTLTLAVSPALLLNGRALRDVFTASAHRFRDYPGLTVAIGGVLALVHGGVIGGVVLAALLALVGAVGWLTLPYSVTAVGVTALGPLAVLAPPVYAYTRALKIEIYRY